jgi:hypothetical protein
MSAYLVRVDETKEFVGIYACDTEQSLFWLVDQCCDPYQCEYTELGFGGIFFPGKCDRFIPLKESTRKEIDDGTNLSRAEFTEELIDFDSKWKMITKDCYGLRAVRKMRKKND